MSWLMVITQSEARVFHLDTAGHLRHLEDLVNPIGRARNRDLKTDKPGLSRAKFKGSSPHALQREKSPHDEAAEQFARQIRDFLRKHLQKRSFTKLKIAAEPRMLGRVRSQTEDFLGDRAEWIAKDLGKVPEHRWPEHLGFERRHELRT